MSRVWRPELCSSILLLFVSFFFYSFFFFNDPPPTEIYTLSLHDALPILHSASTNAVLPEPTGPPIPIRTGVLRGDRKSTRLNSSHITISYAVFCLKKKTRASQISHIPHRHTGDHIPILEQLTQSLPTSHT